MVFITAGIFYLYMIPPVLFRERQSQIRLTEKIGDILTKMLRGQANTGSNLHLRKNEHTRIG